jgi:beta-glucosidase
MWGEEALYIDMPCIYGPGANMHRSPYLGRVNEYIGADPVLTSELLIPFVRECKSKGLVVTVKHFVINDQEQNRIGIGTWTNEQALREIYIRAFEGPMSYGEANGLMTSYNRIGMISTATEYDLVTGVLFNEWGSNAFVITDLGSPTAGLYDGNASIAAGVSVMMNNGVYDDASKAYVNKTLTVESLKNDPVLLRASREACHRILYNFIHSNAVNGIAEDARIELITPWWQTALTAMKLGFGILAAGSTILYLIAANRKKED